MSKNVGWVRLLEPDQKTVRRSRVLLVRNNGEYLMCPLWRSAPNRLVPILMDNEGKMFIDASDPFSYELGSAPTIEQRIDEFNKLYESREINIRILKILSEDDLIRANIPCFTMEDELDQEALGRIPVIRMFV